MTQTTGEHDFSFLKDQQQLDQIVERLGTVVAEVVMRRSANRINGMINEAVDAAVARHMSNGLDSFVASSLEYTVRRGFEQHFQPLLDSWRREEDSANWWRNPNPDPDPDTEDGENDEDA